MQYAPLIFNPDDDVADHDGPFIDNPERGSGGI